MAILGGSAGNIFQPVTGSFVQGQALRAPQAGENTYRWASVTGLSPLRIRLDGEDLPLPMIPETLVDPATLSIGNRVWAQLFARRVIVIGKSFGTGGVIVPPDTNVITVSNPGGQSWTVGTTVSLQLSATNTGALPVTFSATGLPAGLSISTGGLISGVPTTASTGTVIVTATDATAASGSTSFFASVTTGGTPPPTSSNFNVLFWGG